MGRPPVLEMRLRLCSKCHSNRFSQSRCCGKELPSIKDLFVTCRPHVTSVPSLSPGSLPGLFLLQRAISHTGTKSKRVSHSDCRPSPRRGVGWWSRCHSLNRRKTGASCLQISRPLSQLLLLTMRSELSSSHSHSNGFSCQNNEPFPGQKAQSHAAILPARSRALDPSRQEQSSWSSRCDHDPGAYRHRIRGSEVRSAMASDRARRRQNACAQGQERQHPIR
jgi:hypothetical protein